MHSTYSYAAYAAPLILLSYICCTILSNPAPNWASLHSFFELPLTHSTELCCTLLSYDETCWATLFRTTLHLLRNTAPYLAMGHSTELCCTLLSYAAPYWATLYLLSCALPCWAKVHPAELNCTLYELSCTLLSYDEPYLLSYAVP